jgi:DNA-binding LacI/PurR family transcriptional regulator
MKGQPRISIRTTSALAEALGLSRWTVSRALNGGSGVSEKTAQRVKEAARQQGFRPSTLARGLRAGQTDVVGICLPDPEAFFLGGKLGYLLAAIFERGLEPLLQVTDGTTDSEERALGHFAAMRCARVVTFAARLGAKHPALRAMEAAGTRVMHVDPISSHLTGAQVMADRAAAMFLAVRHLHSAGHRRYCVAGLDDGSAYAGQRHEGLRRAASELNLDGERDFVFLNCPPGRSNFETGSLLAEAWLKLGRKKPAAIIALNDRMAFAMMATLRCDKIFAPDDFAIVGYDATQLGMFCDPALTTIDPRHQFLIEKAVDGLWSKEAKRAVRFRIAPKLIVRASTGQSVLSEEAATKRN